MNRNAFMFTSLKTSDLYNYILNFYFYYIIGISKEKKSLKSFMGKNDVDLWTFLLRSMFSLYWG